MSASPTKALLVVKSVRRGKSPLVDAVLCMLRDGKLDVGPVGVERGLRLRRELAAQAILAPPAVERVSARCIAGTA